MSHDKLCPKPPGRTVFTREATGLVKEMGLLDAVWMNVLTVSPFFASIFTFAVAPAVFPGGDFVTAAILGTLGTLAIAAVYGYFTAIMPRSGGDYVFVSRVTNPVIGFFTNLNTVYWFVAFWAFNAFLTAYFFGRLMGDAGQTALATWCGTPVGTFILGSIFSAISCLLLVPGMRTYIKVQLCIVVVTLAATIAGVAVFTFGNFHQAFNAWATSNGAVSGPDPYQTVIHTAASQGFQNPVFSWGATLGVVVIMWSSVNGSWLSSWVSGEMKNGANLKRQLVAMVGGSLFAGVILVLLCASLIGAVGYTFFDSLVYSTSTFPSVPTDYDFFLRIMTAYGSVFDLAFFLAALMWIILDVMLSTRSIFAWAFDRLIPTKLASVSDRFHSPIIAIGVSYIAAEVVMSLLTGFPSAVSLYATATFGTIVSWFIASIAVTVYPYIRKNQFEASVAKQRIGGLPIMTIVGILSMFFLSIMTYFVITVPGLSGFSLITLGSVIVLFIIACAVYYGSRAYHLKKEGIDISLAFKEIPPE